MPLNHKRVLAIYFTQSGQMGEIMQFVHHALDGVGRVGRDGNDQNLLPITIFHGGRAFFFAVMPSCVLGVCRTIETLELKEHSYGSDYYWVSTLVLVTSTPCNSLLQNPEFRALIKDTRIHHHQRCSKHGK